MLKVLIIAIVKPLLSRMTVRLTIALVLSQIFTLPAQNPAITPKKYVDTIDFSNLPQRVNNRWPLSDQKNKGNWQLLTTYSDEFEKPGLDETKWYRNNPKWKGRPPTFFHASNVSIENGELVLSINQHGDTELPASFTHTAGFIKSKKRILFGYFEAELKAMDAPWVSCFWMTHVGKDWWTEIDICENAPGLPYNRHDLNSNLHVFRAPEDKGNVKEHFARPKKYYIPFELQQDYHVWGLEWNEKVIRFYIDGILFREAENTHWHQPLEININNESNQWFGALPDDARLDEKYRIKYFRAWQKRENLE